ncbi:MAG TPA: penicillin-binding protein 2 [Alphaproteobacteria bacterium]|nr:penicillin-binding protein 2 [Alphaproteobacteria bacterium]
MDRDVDRARVFNRRTMLLGGLKLAGLSALVGRMYYLQIVESERYATLAEDNRVNLRLLAPSRGRILDRHGQPMAVNEQNYRLVLVEEQAKDVEAALRQVGQIVQLGDADIRKILREVQRRRAFVPVTVRENLTWEQMAAIEVAAPELPGLSIEVGESRRYPFAHAAAHLMGYVGAVSEAELKTATDPVLSLPGFKIGKQGIEKQHEMELRGIAGNSQLEVNAFGRVIRELNREEGHAGHDVTLTIDMALQDFAAKRLSTEQSAASVVMDAHTGEILVMASNPSFDPNVFATGINAELWEELLSNPTAPLTNKAIAGQYAPGSTFKAAVGLAILENGINAAERVFCPGHMELGDHRFHCWKKGGHGSVDLVDGLKYSCDVYFYEMGRRIGIDRIAEMSRRLGLGAKQNVDLPNERPGLIPDRAWKMGRLNQSWQQGETLIAAIGQGYVLATPLQLATMTARIVNGGYAVEPHLTRQIAGRPPERTSFPAIGIARKNLDHVIRGMNAVVMSERGTAYKARITEPGLEMGGKTGTSQVRRITMAERATGVRKNEDLPWRERDHALFIGYAPIHAPRFVCSVIVEHGGGGSSVAAPICRDLLLETQKRDRAGPTA